MTGRSDRASPGSRPGPKRSGPVRVLFDCRQHRLAHRNRAIVRTGNGPKRGQAEHVVFDGDDRMRGARLIGFEQRAERIDAAGAGDIEAERLLDSQRSHVALSWCEEHPAGRSIIADGVEHPMKVRRAGQIQGTMRSLGRLPSPVEIQSRDGSGRAVGQGRQVQSSGRNAAGENRHVTHVGGHTRRAAKQTHLHEG